MPASSCCLSAALPMRIYALLSVFCKLAAAVTDGEQSALLQEHPAEYREFFPLPDSEERGHIYVSHRQGCIGKEVAGIDVTIGIDGGLSKRDGTGTAA